MDDQALRAILKQYAIDVGGIWDHEGDALERAIEQINAIPNVETAPEQNWKKTG